MDELARAEDARGSAASRPSALLLALLALSACDSPLLCLQDKGEIGTVIREEKLSPPMYSREWQRLTVQRETDGTVCVASRLGHGYAVGDKIRGPL